MKIIFSLLSVLLFFVSAQSYADLSYHYDYLVKKPTALADVNSEGTCPTEVTSIYGANITCRFFWTPVLPAKHIWRGRRFVGINIDVDSAVPFCQHFGYHTAFIRDDQSFLIAPAQLDIVFGKYDTLRKKWRVASHTNTNNPPLGIGGDTYCIKFN